MKHIFKLIDNLIIILQKFPRSINTPEDKADAMEIVEKIIKYTHSLKKLIEAHKTKEYLNKLHVSHINEIKGWADKVNEVFYKLDTLLNNLEKDAEKMKYIIEKQPEKYLAFVSYICTGMAMSGLHTEYKWLKTLKETEIMEVDKLKEIIEYEEHIVELID